MSEGNETTKIEQERPMLPKPTETSSWTSIYIAGLCAFIQATQFSTFFASMWPYILTLDPNVKQSSFGIIVALYSFSQCICSPAFGYWSNRIGQVKLPLIVGFCIMAVGNITYLCLQFLTSYHLYFMMVARFVAGAGTGNMSLLRAYVSTASTSKERSRAIACVSGGIAVGSMIGPGIQILFSPLGAEGITIFGFKIDIYTSPALCCLFLNIVGLMILKFTFNEEYIVTIDKNEKSEEEEEDENEKESSKLANPDFVAIFVCIVTRFSQIFMNTTIESIGSAYSMMMFSLEKEEAVTINATVATIAGSIAAALYMCFIFTNIRKYVRNRVFTVISLLVAFTWFAVTYSYPFYSENVKITANGSNADCDIRKYEWCGHLTKISLWIYYLGQIFTFGVAISFLNITTTTLYSKIIGPRPQGTYQGIFQMSGSVGRFIAPLLMSATYTWYGPSVPWQILMVNFATVIIIWIVLRNRLVPYGQYEKSKSVPGNVA